MKESDEGAVVKKKIIHLMLEATHHTERQLLSSLSFSASWVWV